MHEESGIESTGYGNSFMEKPWYTYAKKLVPNTRSEKKALDIGCGWAGFAKILRSKGYDTYCTDIENVHIENSKKLGFKSKQADFNNPLPFRNNYFDVVACLEVIEHVPNAELLLKEAYRILKPNGLLVISTPNIAWGPYRLLTLLGYPPNNEGFHFRFFTHKTLKEKVTSQGFSIKGDSSFIPVILANRILNHFSKKLLFPRVYFWKQLFCQDMVFLCKK